jgi:hypothetical protein
MTRHQIVILSQVSEVFEIVWYYERSTGITYCFQWVILGFLLLFLIFCLKSLVFHSCFAVEFFVACRCVVGQQPRNKQLYNSRCRVMALQTTAVSRQCLSSDDVVTPTNTNITISMQRGKLSFPLSLPICYKQDDSQCWRK